MLRSCRFAMRIAIAVIAGAWLGNAAAHAGTCPSAIVQLGRGQTPFAVDAPVYDSLYTAFYTAHASFDRTQARLQLDCNSGGGLSASIRIVETFDLTGVPIGTPVDAVLELALDGGVDENCGGAGCGVEFGGSMAAGDDSVAADANIIGPANFHRDLVTTLSVPITLVAGTPFGAAFRIAYATGPGGSASGQLTGRYGVRGLPPGVRAIACGGSDVTPARRTSWGALKTRYR